MPQNSQKVNPEIAYAKRVRRDLIRLASRKGNEKLGEQQLRVAMFLLGSLSYSESRHIPIKKLADSLGLNHQNNVSKAVRTLTKGQYRILAESERSVDDGRKIRRRLWLWKYKKKPTKK